MPFKTTAKKPTTPRDAETKSTPGSKSAKSIFDRDGDKDIDLDDLLIGLRECIQWIVSWRGAMLFSIVFGCFAAYLNVIAWIVAMAPIGAAAPLAGLVTWGFLQWRELAPVLDDLNLKASIASLVRLQRKPLEIPLLNENLHGNAKARLRRYRDRERNAELGAEFIRWVCYGLEFAVLVVGGGILTPMGVSWVGVLLAIVGMVGVEMGLRMFNNCGEKLMTPEEREYLRSIEKTVSRQTVSANAID